MEERGTALNGTHAIASSEEELFTAEGGDGGVALFHCADEEGFIGCSDEGVHVDFPSFEREELYVCREREEIERARR